MKNTLLLSLTLFAFAFSGLAQFDQLIVGANNNGAIISSELNGTLPTQLPTPNGQSFYDGLQHSGNGKVYMSWYYGIYSMDVDGTNYDTLYSYPAGGMGDGMDIDEVNGHLYFTNSQTDSIYRMNLDGTNVIGVYSAATEGYLSDVKVDLANGHIYFSTWIGGGTMGLHRIDLNGSNLTTLYTGADVRHLQLDISNNHIYYSDGAGLNRCDLSGGSNTNLYGTVLVGFTIDVPTNTIYMCEANSQKVVSCDLLGGNVQDLILPSDITLGGDPLENPQGPILVSNSICASTTASITSVECNAYTSPSGNVWTSTGIYEDTILNAGGCDSIITIDLTIVNVDLTITVISQLNATANAIGVGYQWLYCDNNYAPVVGATNQNFTATIVGYYAVEITSGGCLDTTQCEFLGFEGLEENALNMLLELYPNPNNGVFHLALSGIDNGAYSIEICTIQGQVVYTGAINGNEEKRFELEGLSSGVYVAQIRNESTDIRRRLVIE
ncbi:MAG: T9SS type A sorting domain-containing protein [Crocinitomicaceae bacterium]|nr:T9SS type A sorting domain-containing protein [Crocinitomicaceae bacterium]